MYAPLAYYKQGLRLVEEGDREGHVPDRQLDEINVGEIANHIDGLSAAEIREVREHETRTRTARPSSSSSTAAQGRLRVNRHSAIRFEGGAGQPATIRLLITGRAGEIPRPFRLPMDFIAEACGLNLLEQVLDVTFFSLMFPRR